MINNVKSYTKELSDTCQDLRVYYHNAADNQGSVQFGLGYDLITEAYNIQSERLKKVIIDTNTKQKKAIQHLKDLLSAASSFELQLEMDQH